MAKTFSLMTIPTLSDHCYVDGMAYDDRANLIFLSVFGNYSLLKRFRASIALPKKHALALSEVEISIADFMSYHIKLNDNLNAKFMKVPHEKVISLSHLVLYTPELERPDRDKKTAVIIRLPDQSEDDFNVKAWKTIQHLADIPLLDHWRKPVMEKFCQRQSCFSTLSSDGRINQAVKITLDDAFPELISSLLKNGSITRPQVN